MAPEGFNSFLNEYWNAIIVSMVVIAAILVIQLLVVYLLKRLAMRANMAKNQLKTISSVLNIILAVIGATIIIFQFSTSTGIIASAISLSAGTILGFASINTVGNVIAGLLIIAARPYKIGDRIRIGEAEPIFGDVLEITLLYTKMKTIHGEIVSIPNQNLLKHEIRNFSGADSVAVVVYVSMDYSVDRRMVETLLLESTHKIERIIQNPRPYVLLSDFGNFAAVYELRAYTDMPNEYFRVQSELRKCIYDAFQEKGLDLTTPNLITNTNNENPSQIRSHGDAAAS